MKPLAVVVVQAAVVLGWQGKGVLLADGVQWDQVATGGIAGTIVVVGGALVTWWLKIRQERAAGNAQAEKTAIDYYKDLVERGRQNLDDLERAHDEACQERDRALAENGRLRVKTARQEMYAEYLEERCLSKNVKFRAWRDTPAAQPPSATAPPQPKGNGSGVMPTPPRPTPPPAPGESDEEGGL